MTLRRYGIEIIERLLCYDSLSLILLWTFLKAFAIVFCYIFNDDIITMSTLNLIQDLGLLIVFVDARWIETRFVVTACNMIVSCDFHGNKTQFIDFLYCIIFCIETGFLAHFTSVFVWANPISRKLVPTKRINLAHSRN